MAGADGNFVPSSPGGLGGLQESRLYQEGQFRDISAGDVERKFQQWTIWASVPDKYDRAQMYYFAAGVVGLVEGIYYWNGSAWIFAGDYPAARGALYSNTTTALAVGTTDTIVTNYVQGSSSPVEVTQNPAAGTLTIQREGVYLAQAFVNFINPAPNLTWQIVFYKNGAAAELTRTRLTAKDNNDGVNLQTIITSLLVVGDVIDVRMACSSAQNVNIISKLFSLVQQQ